MQGQPARVRGLRAMCATAAAIIAAAYLLAMVVTVPAHAATKVTGGTVTFVTDPAQSEAMFVGGIAPLATSPATLRLTASAWRFRFPIAGGSIDVGRGSGTVNARGGLELWGRETMSVWTVLSFSKLVATAGLNATLTGLDAQGTRRALGTLDMTGATMDPSTSGGHRWLTVDAVAVHMSSWLRSELTDVFPRYDPSGTRLGTLTMKARLD
jgi:hypothetical protein